MRIKPTLCLIGVALIATAAIAGGKPKFLRAPSASLGSPKVIVNWSEVGLGNTGNGINYVASAKAGVHYQCVKKGHVCPARGNKEEILSNVYVSATFTVDKNGRINESLTILPPPSTLVCPHYQYVSVASVVFTNIKLTDVTNGLSAPTNPSALSYNGPECPY
ncbi:hypothetical protein [Noviluteimonas gilva]|uniref:Uncharacterized protein n=1 Tax=Noviluteimonas gilva TaxID=2682097 RepID=A0A7C9HMU0_9GAMM|nr:hypothetical protein [Lysobacter gilvus]MUV14516.1 hypothetical protein [Lysobacter gilvus]